MARVAADQYQMHLALHLYHVSAPLPRRLEIFRSMRRETQAGRVRAAGVGRWMKNQLWNSETLKQANLTRASFCFLFQVQRCKPGSHMNSIPRQRSVIAATSMAHTSAHLYPGKGLASTKEHTSPAAGNVTDEGMFGGMKASAGVGRMGGGCGQKATQQQTAISPYCCMSEGTFYWAMRNYLMMTGEKSPFRPSPSQRTSISSLMFLLVKDEKSAILWQH